MLELNNKKSTEEGCIRRLLQQAQSGGKAYLLLTGFAVTKPPEPSSDIYVLYIVREVLQQCVTLQQIKHLNTEINFKTNSCADIG